MVQVDVTSKPLVFRGMVCVLEIKMKKTLISLAFMTVLLGSCGKEEKKESNPPVPEEQTSQPGGSNVCIGLYSLSENGVTHEWELRADGSCRTVIKSELLPLNPVEHPKAHCDQLRSNFFSFSADCSQLNASGKGYRKQ